MVLTVLSLVTLPTDSSFTMYFLLLLSLSTIFGAYGFNFYGVGNGYRYLRKQMSNVALSDSALVETRWLEQPLDHFDSKENRTWKMMYLENLEFWKQNGTIYLFIGGEDEACPAFLKSGIMYELAKDTNGAMFESEHRYYGKSIPLPIDHLVTENLKYLSSRQALADLATLLEEIRSRPQFKESTDSKVVVIGGSYAGNLAAWMKLLYPDKVDAAIASSAPVLAKKDFYEYYEKVSDDYEKLGSSGCHDKIREIFSRYERLLKTASGTKRLKEEENICQYTDMSKPENQQLFFMDKTSGFMVRAQYGTPALIQHHCSKLMNATRIVSSKDAEFDELSFWREKTDCYDYDFYTMIDEIKENDFIVLWIYQACTEFGYFQSTTSDAQPFTKNIPPELYYKMCTEIFGPEFNENRIDKGIKATNDLYGGLKPNVTKVVFVNGDMDPWSTLGVLADISNEAPAKVIPNSSHRRDLFSDKKGDPEELKEGRKYVKNMIKKWIGAGK